VEDWVLVEGVKKEEDNDVECSLNYEIKGFYFCRDSLWRGEEDDYLWQLIIIFSKFYP
jgi:hypothetical protein